MGFTFDSLKIPDKRENHALFAITDFLLHAVGKGTRSNNYVNSCMIHHFGCGASERSVHVHPSSTKQSVLSCDDN